MLRSFWLQLSERENARHPVTAGHDVQDSTFWCGVTRTIAVVSVLQRHVISVNRWILGRCSSEEVQSLERPRAMKYAVPPMQPWFIPVLLLDADDIDAVVGPLLLLVIIGSLAYYGFRRLRMRTAPSRWTLTEGTLQSDMPYQPTSPGRGALLGGQVASAVASHYWKCVLQYSYQVVGEFYSGYVMLGEVFYSSEDASAAARPWLQRRIFVRYNPKKPYESAFLVADGAPAGSRSLGDQPPASEGMITLSLK